MVHLVCVFYFVSVAIDGADALLLADEPVDSIVALARRLDHGRFPLAQVIYYTHERGCGD